MTKISALDYFKAKLGESLGSGREGKKAKGNLGVRASCFAIQLR
ncbi:MAG: hypothetical protein RRA15_11050 [bacterium]|nr:hypothetical protein [bacterium]MDT8367009.1 hypothetical protein [bacterium]